MPSVTEKAQRRKAAAKPTLRHCPSFDAYGFRISRALPCLFHPNGQNAQGKDWSHLSSSRKTSGRPGHTHSAATDAIFKPFRHYGAKSENRSKPNGFATSLLPRTTAVTLLRLLLTLLLKAAILTCFKYFKWLLSSGLPSQVGSVVSSRDSC